VPYNVIPKAITKKDLKELTQEDSKMIFNQFAEILRHNIVSDKSNAFNKIFNLFLCKIVDENRSVNDELSFQWKDDDTYETLQKRLSELYKQGMEDYLAKQITDFNDQDIDVELNLLNASNNAAKNKLKEMITQLRFYKNNEFSFKEVFDKKSFDENSVVVKSMVQLLQPYQLKYSHKQQFLGDFFELLLNTGLKQETGQFFTPVPIAKFIISSLPILNIVNKKINNRNKNILPYTIDYAAGSGHFLTEAMDEIQNIIQNKLSITTLAPDQNKNVQGWIIDPYKWAGEYIYGIEADYRLVKTAKVSTFLNGDGEANVIHANGLDNFNQSNDFVKLLKTSNSEQDNPVFDMIVANPPYSVSAFKNTLKNGQDSFTLYNKLTDQSSEIECLFIERTKQLLTVGGVAGIILPSSFLTNGGIYSDSRAFILKYFKIKAIALFGANTFMATGTNTATLFLEKRDNNKFLVIESDIKLFFTNNQDITVNKISNAISTYAKTTYNFDFNDYVSLFSSKPTTKIKSSEIYQDTRKVFESSDEIKKAILSNKKKNSSPIDIEQKFIDFLKNNELYKIAIFCLFYEEKTLLINSGEKQAEKEFLGYEFSERRGNEGIKIYRDSNGKHSTKLYDEDDSDKTNQNKVNTLIHNMFIKDNTSVPTELENNVIQVDSCSIFDFTKPVFDNIINGKSKKKDLILNSIYPLEKLGKVCNILIGGTPSRQNRDYFTGENLWVSIREMNGSIINDTKEKITDVAVKESNVKLIPKDTTLLSFKLSLGKTAIAGKELYTNEAIAGLIPKDKSEILNKFIYALFSTNFITLYKDGDNVFGKSLNSKDLSKILIPVPDIKIQENIVKKIDKLTEIEDKLKERNNKLQDDISCLMDNTLNDTTNIETIGKIAE
jgi:type I restriction enzyme M protein